jgi:hypothetical protein
MREHVHIIINNFFSTEQMSVDYAIGCDAWGDNTPHPAEFMLWDINDVVTSAETARDLNKVLIWNMLEE